MVKKVLLISAAYFLSSVFNIAMANDHQAFEDLLKKQRAAQHNYDLEYFKHGLEEHRQKHSIEKLSQELKNFPKEKDLLNGAAFNDLGLAQSSQFQYARKSFIESKKSMRASYNTILHIDKQLTRPAELNTWYNSARTDLTALCQFIQAIDETLKLYGAAFATSTYVVQSRQTYQTHLVSLFGIDQVLTANKEIIQRIQNERQDFCELINKAKIDAEGSPTQSTRVTPILQNRHTHLTTNIDQLHEKVKNLIKLFEIEYKKLPSVNE